MSDSESRSLLEQLASQGLRAVPADQFVAVAEECHARASVAGDARYPVLEELLRELLDWWSDHDERGGIPTPIADDFQRLITKQLPEILAAPTAPEGYRMARELASDVRKLMTGPNDWRMKGYLASP